jgi:hypothetical protein
VVVEKVAVRKREREGERERQRGQDDEMLTHDGGHSGGKENTLHFCDLGGGGGLGEEHLPAI